MFSGRVRPAGPPADAQQGLDPSRALQPSPGNSGLFFGDWALPPPSPCFAKRVANRSSAPSVYLSGPVTPGGSECFLATWDRNEEEVFPCSGEAAVVRPELFLAKRVRSA